MNSTAQNNNLITDVVTDTSIGKPIAHTEVLISETANGWISDVKGKFSLKVPFFSLYAGCRPCFV